MTFGDWQTGVKPPWGEGEWLASRDPSAMLAFLGKEAPERKRRLFAVACCRRIWDLSTTDLHRKAVELAERSADGEVSEEEYGKMVVDLQREYDDSEMECEAMADPVESMRQFRYDNPSFQETAQWTLDRRWDMPWSVSNQAAWLRAGRDEAFDLDHGVGKAAAMTAEQRGQAMRELQRRVEQEREAQARLLRDLFGNPFRTIRVNKDALPDKVKQLAGAIYDDRAFDIMPVLADLLEETGCSEAEILTHCRSGGEHVRGCWVLDLLLGKWGDPPPALFTW
jgi:hypothetical protein